jgi:hypothetical protein
MQHRFVIEAGQRRHVRRVVELQPIEFQGQQS